jgi:Fe-S cluster assembly protein SufB
VSDSTNTIETFANQEYKWGFVTDIEADAIPRGLSEDVVRLISAKKHEPEWLLEWRLKAYRHWLTMKEPTWANVHYPPIDYQDIIYYSSPKPKGRPQEPGRGRSGAAQDLRQARHPAAGAGHPGRRRGGRGVRQRLRGHHLQGQAEGMGIIFGSFSEAVREHPDLVRQYLGSVVPSSDNFFAALNSAVFSDGSFCYVPKGVRCPMELSTYFRINAKDTGQFERTLIVADEGAYVSYLEGCTAPMRDTNQLHAAVVELVALDNAQIKYSTVQNWYPGDKEGKGGIYNFVTKRGACRGVNSKISWTQVETGSAITWKYPSCLLMGDNSVGEFYSVALTNNWQQADTGTKMIHIGKNTTSAPSSPRASRPATGRTPTAAGQDSEIRHRRAQLLAVRFPAAGRQVRRAHVPLSRSANTSAQVEHEASTSKIGEDQIFYCRQRGISSEDAVSMIVHGFCKEVFRELPMEFAVEAQKLLGVSLEGSVG